MNVSLVLPCYKPPADWEQTVYHSFQAFSAIIGEQVELVVVLDGALVPDETLSFLKKNITRLQIINYTPNKGKGYAIRQGVAKASGDIIIYTDVDFPYTSASMVAVYDGLKNKRWDVAVGVKDAAYYSHVPFLRKVISRILRALIRFFLAMPITDTQCGLKGFRSNVSTLFLQTTIDRYLFDLEFIRNCFKSKKFRVQAIPVSLNEQVHFRSMNYRILLSESINFIRLLFQRTK